MLDALGKTINETGVRLSNMIEDERPDKVVFLIITDGEENASREFTQNQISEKVNYPALKGEASIAQVHQTRFFRNNLLKIVKSNTSG